jgi:amino acid adenylation domain-containing protein
MPSCPSSFPLFPTQKGLWAAQLVSPGAASFCPAQYTRIIGTLDPNLFEKASRHVLALTEALRLTFSGPADSPVQLLNQLPDWRPEFRDFSTSGQPEDEALAWMRGRLGEALSLEAPAFEWSLLRLGPLDHIWYFRAHHLLLDGFGRNLVLGRLREAYAALAANQQPPSWPDELGMLLADLAKYEGSNACLRDRQFWLERLADRPDSMSLSGAGPVASRASRRVSRHLPRSLMDALSKLSPSGSSTAALVLGCAIYQMRMTFSKDILLGFTTSGRMNALARRVPATLSNIMPLRICLSSDVSIHDAMACAARELQLTLRHQRYRSEELRRDLGLRPSDPDVFTCSLNVMPFDSGSEFLSGHGATTHNLLNGPVADLAFGVFDQPGTPEVRIDLNGNCELYDDVALISHLDRVVTLLTAMTEIGPECMLAELSIVTKAKLGGINNLSSFGLDAGAMTLPEVLAEPMRRKPDAIAVCCGSTQLAYSELDGISNQLARELIGRSIGPEDIVGLALPRSLDLPIGLLAILKSGAAFMPLDLHAPAGRLAWMLQDGAPKLVITTRAFAARIEFLAPGLETLCIDDPEWRKLLQLRSSATVNQAERKSRLDPSNLAYLIYTSGSSGRPKGVEGVQRALANRLMWMATTYPFTEGEAAMTQSSLAFIDGSTELLGPFAGGGRVLLVDDAQARDPRAIASTILAERNIRVTCVPSLLASLLDFIEDEPAAREITGLWVTSGETLSPILSQRLRRMLPGVRLFNLYGMTEAAGDSLWAEVTEGPVAIGSPIWGTQVILMDDWGSPVPQGGIGEIYIGGVGLARGYRGLPVETALRFISSPFGPNDFLYRTGDLGRLRADGAYECLGRVDRQVKIRGSRIEMEDIEAILRGLPGVKAAAADLRVANGTQCIVGYVVPGLPQGMTVRDAKQLLAHQLPEYAIPMTIVALSELPRTGTGKLDRRALPEPSGAAERTYEPACSADEEVICKLFADITGVEKIGAEDDFFEIGGHSLSAARLTSLLRKTGRVISLSDVFDNPSPRRIAYLLGARRGRLQGKLRNAAIAFLLPGVGGDEQGLATLRAMCRPGLELIPLDYPDLNRLASPGFCFEAMAEEIADFIGRNAPHGPVRLVGYSYGGLVAMAISHALNARKILVAETILIDADMSIVVRTPLRRLRRFAGATWTKKTATLLAWPVCRPLVRSLAEATNPGPKVDALRHQLKMTFRMLVLQRWAKKNVLRSDWPVTLLRVTAGEAARSDYGWKGRSPELQVLPIPGDHRSLLQPDNLHEVASLLVKVVLDQNDRVAKMRA